MEIKTESEAVDKALTTLSVLTRQKRMKLEDLCEDYAFHDWQGDPFSRGAYSYVGVGGDGAPAVLARPVQNTLFFAGEATAPEGRNGTVDGALTSGYRAAEEIKKRRGS
jgi:monoamine oxidase